MQLYIIFGVIAFIMIGFILFIHTDFLLSTIPMITFGCIIILEIILGIFRVLYIGNIIFYILILLLFGITVMQNKSKVKSFFLNAQILYIIFISISIIIAFCFKEMTYNSWDEISHWGPFCKSIFESNQIPMHVSYNMIHCDYLQGFQVFYYFFSFFMPEFTETSIYIILLISLNIISSSMFCILKKREYICFLLLAGIAATYLSFFFEFQIYSTIYLDGLAGAYFGSFLISLYYEKMKRKNLFIFVVLFLISFVQLKSSVLPLSMVCCGIYFIVMLSENKGYKNKVEWAKSALLFLLAVCTALFTYIGWNILYNIFGLPNIENAFSNHSIQERYFDFLENGSQSFAYKFTLVFFDGCLNKTIGGIQIIYWLLGMIAVVIVIGVILYKSKDNRILFWVIMPISLVFMLGVLYYSYLFQWKEGRALLLGSFERYILPLIIGWVMMVFVYALEQLDKIHYKVKLIIVSIFTFCCIYCFTSNEMSNYFAKSSGVVFNNDRERIIRISDQILKCTNDDDVILVISQGNDGLVPFFYNYELLGKRDILDASQQVVCSFSVKENIYSKESSAVIYSFFSKEEFKEMIKDKSVDFILVNFADDLLREGYGDLFDDKILTGEDWDAKLYEVKEEELSPYKLIGVF